ncbi:MAG: 2-succinyl-5-enolpyruvyl-6-hydroxy-3-cyclohexene-1-carboxylic-acid synthase [Deltaproteobacteria bacterium HGW-Deltaproteobacteria-9]|nr:MAG: 2-succinyl-5-enolpyruvyl-6-hydroxy-3-cyclohexene-1-carboxylic-acid synthase [Deltaproteobacteria bacterium HGW-Deltaproteobacteria-9]
MPRPPLSDHLNLLWSSLIVAELIKNGIDTFFISPGNRNAPLISALACEERAMKKTCLDERAAGYRALGYAKATGLPGALVCTSGTAPANYYPAVIEACREDVPLIILSADRPPELVGSDANQTIIQQDIFGRYCRDSLFLPCPDFHYPLEALLAKMDHIIHNLSGPAHINCPFRDPLTPGVCGQPPIPEDILEKAERLFDFPKPYTTYSHMNALPDLHELLEALRQTRRGLVIIGRLDKSEDAPALELLLQTMDWPVFCDIASSLKGRIPADRQIFSIDHPGAIQLINDYQPDTILQFGSGLISKYYYTSILPQSKATVIQVSPRSGLRDPAHRINWRIEAPISAVAELFIDEVFPSVEPDAFARLMMSMESINSKVEQCIETETLSFALIASILLADVPESEGLFLGNSIAIRAFDAVLPTVQQRIHVISNRGVSGIEGNIATSVGFAEGSGQRVTTVIGDISFLHDLNSLLLLKQSTTPVVLVVVNNGGGRIFERLPINNFPEIVNPYITTPHNMNFKMLAEQFALPYFRIAKPQELTLGYKQALQGKCSALLEVILSPEDDLRTFTTMQQVRLP